MSQIVYTDATRGKIILPHLNQQKDYSGLRRQKITPTDIDGVIEYKNYAYFFIEMKYPDVEMPRGQEVALTRLVHDLQKIKPATIMFVATHNTPRNETIDCAGAIVEKYLTKSGWKTPKNSNITLGECVQKFYDFCDQKIKDKY